MLSVRLLSISVAAVAVLSSTLSCKSYDEQDVTIIAYLKVNDLIEQKLSQTCEAEISQFDEDYSEHVNLMSADFFGITDVFYDTFGYMPAQMIQCLNMKQMPSIHSSQISMMKELNRSERTNLRHR